MVGTKYRMKERLKCDFLQAGGSSDARINHRPSDTDVGPPNSKRQKVRQLFLFSRIFLFIQAASFFVVLSVDMPWMSQSSPMF